MVAKQKRSKRHADSSIKHFFLPTVGNGRHAHVLRRDVVLSAIAVVLFAELAALSSGLLFQSPAMTASVLPAAIVDLSNQQRVENNLQPLAVSDLLTEAAQAKANDMAAKGYFAHVSPDGTLPWYWFTQAGYDYQFAGENLAVDFTDSDQVVQAWMNSPEHRANILKQEYTQIGIGIASGMYQGHQTIFVVQFFAKPQPVAAATAPSTPAPKPQPRPAQRVAPTPASTPATTPLETAAPTAQASVLGAQSAQPSAAAPFSAIAASPHTYLSYLLVGLAALFIVLLVLGFLPSNSHLPHPSALASGGALVAVVLAVLIVNENIFPSVGVDPPDAQHASVALPLSR